MPRGGNRWHKYGAPAPKEDRHNLRKSVVLDNGYDANRYEANPLTGDRLYSDQEREFLAAAEAYRQQHKKKFLNATDYFRVLLSLGYQKG